MGISEPASAFESETFGQDASFRLEQPVGSMSISPCGRDVVLASKEGLHIIDLDSPYSPPRYLPHRTSWEVADVQWSPFASRDYWVVSTSNQKALVWNLAAKGWQDAIEFKLHGHTRAITDINFSAHHPDVLATCAVDSFVHCWDLRDPRRPAFSFSDWFAGATQVKWSRQDSHVVASSHDRYLHIWDDRNGAHPTRSIKAHDTKIYGVDWNRFHSEKIVTCSLDKTVKFWNCNNEEDVPERTIETPFPVWRARHTPFGWGLLAMPQRGSSDLHLYDRRFEEDTRTICPTAPVFSFGGHKGQVKEFLWRARGNIIDDIDHREFQLVSWGTDRELRLHRIEKETLKAIAYEKGVTPAQRLNFTRKGANYKTFRDDPVDSDSPVGPPAHRDSASLQSQSLRLRPRGSTSVGMSKISIPQFRGWAQSGKRAIRTGMHGKNSTRQDISAISWMKNVRIAAWDQETLADEVTQIGVKFPRVEFEELDIPQRKLTVSLYGPWGDESASVYLRVDMKFPKLYPRDASAKITVQRTTSLGEEVLGLLSKETHTIAETYASRRRGCIEAVLRYLLRDQNLEQAISLALDENLAQSKLSADPDPEADLSSDDDDQVQAPADLLNASNPNVGVPMAKACGAMWSDNGTLVCFFPPRVPQATSIINAVDANDSEHLRSMKRFEGFGRLHTGSPGPKTTIGTKTDDDSSDTSERSDSTSSSSSDDSDEAKVIFSGFLPHKAWHRSAVMQRRPRSADRSNRSTNGFGPMADPARTNIVSIHSFEDLIPSKPSLALGYRIFGNGPDVCDHNAIVALQTSDEMRASVWQLAKLILQNNVPLECVHDERSKGDVITIAKNARLALNRKDSGIDLSHDFRSPIPNPLRPGRVRWGNSPLGPTYLIPALFRHFENMGDVQMLAMLSCVFAEPRATRPDLALREDQDMSIELQAPAFSVDYYPSLGVAKSIINAEPNSVLTVGGQVRSKSPLTPGIESSSSEAAQSNGLLLGRGSETTGNTPPSASGVSFQDPRRSSRVSAGTLSKDSVALDSSTPNSGAVSMSTSPEENRTNHRSNSGLAFSFSRASLSALQQSYSSSPPTASSGLGSSQKSHSPSGSLVPSGWSTGGIFGSSSGGKGTRTPVQTSAASSDEQRSGHLLSSSSFTNLRNPRRVGSETPDLSHRDWRSGLSTVVSSSTKTVKVPGRGRPRVTAKLHNQDMFDDDGYASVPLLDPASEWKYKAYRASYAHLLGVWEFFPQMAEVLKFDGLIGYFSSGSAQHHEVSFGDARRRKTMSEESIIAAIANGGLQIRRCCHECGKSLAPIEKNDVPIGWYCTTPKCPSTNRTSMREICVICNERIDGLMVPCLQCGHITCYECAHGWFGPQGEVRIGTTLAASEDAGEELPAAMEPSCPTGCGCLCSSLDTATVPFPTEPDAEPEREVSPLDRHKSYRSERLMSLHGPDTAIGAFLSLTRTRSISAAKESVLRDRHVDVDEEDAIEYDAVTPGTDDGLDPWSKSKFAGLGRGIGGGLSQGLSSKSSDATIRKSMAE